MSFSSKNSKYTLNKFGEPFSLWDVRPKSSFRANLQLLIYLSLLSWSRSKIHSGIWWFSNKTDFICSPDVVKGKFRHEPVPRHIIHPISFNQHSPHWSAPRLLLGCETLCQRLTTKTWASKLCQNYVFTHMPSTVQHPLQRPWHMAQLHTLAITHYARL